MLTTSSRILYERTLTSSLLRLSDSVSVLGGFAITALHPGVVADRDLFLGAAIAVIAVLLIGELAGIYGSWRGVAKHRELAAVAMTWTYVVLGLLFVGFATRYFDRVPRTGLLVCAGAVFALLTLTRSAVRFTQRSLMAHGFQLCKFAIIGVTDLGIRLAKNLEDMPELGLELAGFFDDRPKVRTSELPKEVGERLGDTRQLVDMAKRGEVQRIYITLPMRAERRVRELLDQLADTTASVYIVPDFYVFELLHSRWTDINGLPVVSVFESPFYGIDGWAKRLCDLALAMAALIVAAIPMLIIATAIKLTSPGPVFFRQRRYGLDGREIRVWKFRSMSVCDNGPMIQQATKHDPRITPLGSILRRSSLDELPQLFNVLEGNMSLVGPRPHASAHNEQYRRLIPGYMLRHKVKPGITGLAQVLGWRGETDTLDKMGNRVRCDLQYIREWSLWLDLQIMIRTILVVCTRHNAH